MMLLPLFWILSTEYFPLSEGHAWSYKQTVTLKGKTTDKTAHVFVVGRSTVGKNEGFVVQGWGGADRAVLQVSEEGVRVLQMESNDQESLYFLKFPLKVGATWEGKLKAGEQIKAMNFEVAGEEEITVPAGKFKAFRVKLTSKESPDHVGEIWYARDFGEVRSKYTMPDGEVVSELEKFEKGQIHYRCAKCAKTSLEQIECCGARMERAPFAREAKACRCGLVHGKGVCKCLHCSGEKDAKCYCDTGGCECGKKLSGCTCAHCKGQDGAEDGQGGCRCPK